MRKILLLSLLVFSLGLGGCSAVRCGGDCSKKCPYAEAKKEAGQCPYAKEKSESCSSKSCSKCGGEKSCSKCGGEKSQCGAPKTDKPDAGTCPMKKDAAK